MSRILKVVGCSVLVLLTMLACVLLLFIVNGIWLAHNETPLSGQTTHARTNQADFEGHEITIMSYNIAKGFIHKGGLRFEDEKNMRARLRSIADLINAEQPDIVFLSETIFECGASPVNQIVTLAEATGMTSWVFGENYNLGLPFYRIVGGNAILSRRQLKTIENPALAGRQPFYISKNNRRILWASLQINGQNILLGTVHTDSFRPSNNLAQTRQILDYVGNRPAILAGDFNARPQEASMQLLRNSGQFIGDFDGPLTFPASEPRQKIDYILAPASWKIIDHRVISSAASDHLPIVSTFAILFE